MYKPFLFFILLITTVVLPVNVFGFNQIDDKVTNVGEQKKDQISFTFFGFFTVPEYYVDSTEIFESSEMDDLNLRWEPHNSFLGDDTD